MNTRVLFPVLLLVLMVVVFGAWLLGGPRLSKKFTNSLAPPVPTQFSSRDQVRVCPQVDSRFQIVDSGHTVVENELLPVSIRSFPLALYQNHIFTQKYFGAGYEIGAKRGLFHRSSPYYVPELIHAKGEEVNGNVFTNTYLPPAFTGYDFFGFIDVLGLADKWYVLSSQSCSYGKGVCQQKLQQISVWGGEAKEIKIPRDYSPKLESWSGGQEGGIRNINTFLRSIAGDLDDRIVFRVDKGNFLVTYATASGEWLKFSGSESEVRGKNPAYEVLEQFDCYSYPVPIGEVVFLRDELSRKSFTKQTNIFYRPVPSSGN